MARWTADRAVDMIRDRFGWDAVGYGSVVLGPSRSVPDEFRELAEKDLQTTRHDVPGITPRQKSVESISLSARPSYRDAYARLSYVAPSSTAQRPLLGALRPRIIG